MANDVLGAQAHFVTTQQSFSSSFGPKKQTCDILKVSLGMLDRTLRKISY